MRNNDFFRSHLYDTKEVRKELYRQYSNGTLTEYLKLLSLGILNNLSAEIAPKRKVENVLPMDMPIYDAIVNEIEYRFDEIHKRVQKIKENYQQARVCMYNHELTDYFKTYSDIELEDIIGHLVPDDIIGDRAIIYEAARNELEYRKSDRELEQRAIVKKYKR